MDQQRDSRIVDKIEGLLGGRVGGHDDRRVWAERRGRQVCVVHERYMGKDGVACREMKLQLRVNNASVLIMVLMLPYKSSILETCDNF